MSQPTAAELQVEVLEHMRTVQKKLVSDQREESVRLEIPRYRNAGTKRIVGLTRRLLYRISDSEEIYKVDEEDEDFVKADNIEIATMAIKHLLLELKEIKDLVQIIAATSHLGWKTVNEMKGVTQLPSCVMIENSDRK